MNFYKSYFDDKYNLISVNEIFFTENTFGDIEKGLI